VIGSGRVETAAGLAGTGGASVSRRTLTGLAAAGAGLPLLAACGSDDSSTAVDAGAPTGTPSTEAASSPPTQSSAPTPESSSSAAVPDGLTSTSDIEVGGGAIFADAKVVVTQPTEGEFKAFSAVCTHQGCLVASVSDGTINCDCHGSRFSIETGEPESGPASSPLGDVKIAVTGDQISLS
jgi:Rieske Fe-S protein